MTIRNPDTRKTLRHAAIAAMLSLPSTASALPGFETLALTGQQAPGADPGVVFSYLSNPNINATGQTAFIASLSGPGVIEFDNSAGIYGGTPGQLEVVARQGDKAPDTGSGVVFRNLLQPAISANGQVAFSATLTGPGIDSSTNAYRIYRGDSENLEVVARQGDPVPGAANPNNVFHTFAIPPLLNDTGQIIFHAGLVGGSQNTNTGIYSDRTGVLSEIARWGDQAPGAMPGVVFSAFHVDYVFPVFNAAGQAAFVAGLTGPGVDRTNDSAVYSETSGVLAEVAREGGQVPNAVPGVVFKQFVTPGINAPGQTLFAANLTGTGVDGSNDRGIYIGEAGTLTEVVRKGNPAPAAGPGVVFSTVSSSKINASGQVLIGAWLSGPGVDSSNRSALYIGGNHSLTKIAREGDQAPGAEPGVVFDTFNNQTINKSGQVAFLAELSGQPGIDISYEAIYATDQNGQLVEIIRTGELFDVDDDPLIQDMRTVQFLNMLGGSGNADGRPSAFNDLGQLAFLAHFTDGSQGIFMSNLVTRNNLPADLDDDGDVDGIDLGIMFANFNGPGGGVPANPDTDLDDDGDVDGVDLAAAFAQFTGPLSPANVPEPSSLVLLAMGGLLGRRRRMLVGDGSARHRPAPAGSVLLARAR